MQKVVMDQTVITFCVRRLFLRMQQLRAAYFQLNLQGFAGSSGGSMDEGTPVFACGSMLHFLYCVVLQALAAICCGIHSVGESIARARMYNFNCKTVDVLLKQEGGSVVL